MNSRHRQWRPQLTASECRRGWVFFALYFLVFPQLMGLLQVAMGDRWELFPAEYSLIYHLLSVTLILLVFWGFLRNSFDILLDWLPENLFAMGTGSAGWLVLSLVLNLIPLPVENPSGWMYLEQFSYFPQATVLILVVLYPIVEETLFRGLLYGSVHRYSRGLGYVLSILVFAFFKAQQFAFVPGALDLRYLLLMLQYLPMAAALTWCYDNGGSVWSAVILHMALNGVYLFQIVH